MRKSYNFFEESNGREIFMWSGTYCFISDDYGDKNPGKVQITTYDGRVIENVPESQVSVMTEDDMTHF